MRAGINIEIGLFGKIEIPPWVGFFILGRFGAGWSRQMVKKDRKLEKIIKLLKSWQGQTPDYENLDFSDYKQTEEEYQKNQKEWLEAVKKKKKGVIK